MADVNGVRFHLLTGRHDWQSRLEGTELVWNDARAAVHLKARLLRLPDRRRRRVLTPDERRGAGRDPFGHVWWIGDDRRSLRLAAAGDRRRNAVAWTVDDLRRGCPGKRERGSFRPVDEPAPAPVPALRGLAVTAGHFLVVGTLDPGGLLIFDLHAGGPPTWWRWPPELDLRPFDLAADERGGLWVLDRDGEVRLWYVDRHFRIVPLAGLEEVAAPRTADFKPVDGPERTLPGLLLPVPLELADPLASPASPPELAGAVAVAALPGDLLLALESDPALGFSRVHLLRCGAVVDTVSLEGALEPILEVESPPVPADLRGHDLAVLAEAGPLGAVDGVLFVAEDDGQQVFAFQLEVRDDALALRPQARFLPIESYTGKDLVAAPPGGSPPHGDLEPPGEILYAGRTAAGDVRWLPLAELPRPRYSASAELRGLVFDGKEPEAEWHRLMLDACIPAGDAVAVASRVAESEDLLALEPWREEPVPYLRSGGSEIPYHEPWSADERRLARGGLGTWELLFQEARGRFLELRLTVRCSGRTTPRIRALRVYYPRFSYVGRYLPAVYRDDPASASFLERYLANPEGILTEIEGRVERAQTLFDVDGAPSEALDWLASWLGAVLDPEWDDARRRLFLAHAEQLFRWRGTRGGLLRAIRLAIDPCPDETLFDGLGTADDDGAGGVRIVEDFLLRSFPGVALGDPTAVQPAFIAGDASWEPAQGVVRLHELYREYRSRFGAVPDGLRFPPTIPRDDGEAELWRDFVATEIAFTYAPANAADERDHELYRDFLARRYGSTASIARTHGLGPRAPGSFRDVRLPAEMPAAGAALFDWVRFVSQVLPTKTRAHRFTVLVPATPGEDPEERARRKARVEEIVRREKPAHTDFDVELFWALFRVGSARLGLDTQVGESSRFAALALGLGRLGEARLAVPHPWNVAERRVLGRDRLEEDGP